MKLDLHKVNMHAYKYIKASPQYNLVHENLEYQAIWLLANKQHSLEECIIMSFSLVFKNEVHCAFNMCYKYIAPSKSDN